MPEPGGADEADADEERRKRKRILKQTVRRAPPKTKAATRI
jgi:hypothetical protein